MHLVCKSQRPYSPSSNWKVKGEFMKISDAALKVGLPVKTIRYYSDIGLVTPTGRSAAGYRDYDHSALKKLVFIRRAREFGFSIDECRDLLDLYEDQNRSSADVKHLASLRLRDIEQKQKELQLLRDELSHLVQSCKGDGRPDCPILSNFAQV